MSAFLRDPACPTHQAQRLPSTGTFPACHRSECRNDPNALQLTRPHRFSLASSSDAAAASVRSGDRGGAGACEHGRRRTGGESFIGRHDAACARGAGGQRAGRRVARRTRLGRPAHRAPARLAHLLEERRRFRPADRTVLDASRRHFGRRHRLAGAEEDSDRHPRQLRLRRHRAAARAARRRSRLSPADGADRSADGDDPAQGVVAGLPTGMHPRRR